MSRIARFSFGTVLALLLSLAVVATTFAGSSTSAAAVKTVCKTSGGVYGYGHTYLKVLATEWGVSGVNKIKFRGDFMEGASASGPWTSVGHVTGATPYFTNTSADHAYTYWAAWDPNKAGSKYWWRVDITVSFWKTDGADKLIAQSVLHSKSC